MSRAFVSVLVCLAIPVAVLVSAMWHGPGTGQPGAHRLAASPVLSKTFLAELCRQPSDQETVEWESRPIQEAGLAAALRPTPEGEAIGRGRRLLAEALRRDPTPADCVRIREWVDRALTPEAARRALDDTQEGRRVSAVRQIFLDVFARDPREWDDSSLRWWVDSPFTLSQIRSRLVAQRPVVGLHYFTWYRPQDGGWRNDVTVVPAEAPRPAGGWYASQDVEVMRRQLGQMASIGVDFVIVHVIAQSPASWANARTFFRLIADSRVKAAILLDGLHTETASAKAMWVEQARAEFAGRSTYFRYRGLPLLMVYSAPLDFDASGVQLRNVYWNDRYDPGRNTFNADLRLYPRDWPFWSSTPQPLVNGVVPVIPGYLDTQLGRNQTMEFPRENGRLYHEQWQRALRLRPEVILIYSWNEYFERTAIEPTDAWGDQYLRWTRCYVAHAHRGTTGDCR